MKASSGFLIVVSASLLVSALAAVYMKHHSRQLFIQLEALKAERDDLNIEWNRLMLEQATWATPTRIEMIARDRLQMVVPPSDKVVTVTP